MNTIRKARAIRDRNDSGVGVIGLVVTLVILSIIAAIGGPPLWRLITDANEAKLNSHLEQAAEALRTRFRLKPELLSPDTTTPEDGSMQAELRDDLTAEWGVPWEDWDGTFAAADGDDQTFYVQAIHKDGTKLTAAAGATAPVYPFIAKSGGAWRIMAYNADGAWACALIVQLPKVTAQQVGNEENYVGTSLPDTSGGNAVTAVSAWMVGEWYDRGERLLDGTGMNNVCSPVIADSNGTPNVQASLPTSVNTWPVGDTGAIATDNGSVTQKAASTSHKWPDASDVKKDEQWRAMSGRL